MVDDKHGVDATGSFTNVNAVCAELLLLIGVDRSRAGSVGRLVKALARDRRGEHLDGGEIARVDQMNPASRQAGRDDPLGSGNRHQVFRCGDAADELDVAVWSAAAGLL